MFQIKKEDVEVELQAATDNKRLFYHRGLWKDARIENKWNTRCHDWQYLQDTQLKMNKSFAFFMQTQHLCS